MITATIIPAAKRLAMRRSMDRLEGALHDGVKSGRFQKTIEQGGSEEGDAQCQHAFGDGVYCRGLWIPADTCVAGRIHKQARVVVIAAGRCMFADEFRSEQVSAPWMGELRAGSKTMVYAIEDCYWVACLGTDLKDSRTAFDELTAATYEEYTAFLADRSTKPEGE